MSTGSRVLLASADSYHELISTFIRQTRPHTRTTVLLRRSPRRQFHDYFVTHLPSSSLHPDSRRATGLAHKLPRSESTPHKPDGKSQSAPASHPSISRDTTVVRIPLKSAKHHYGVAVSRGSRPYNEDSHQAGIIELPAFARRPPRSLTLASKTSNEGQGAESATGDPQVFFFGVYDGHGGAECSGFLQERLHRYVEETSVLFELRSSLRDIDPDTESPGIIDGNEENVQPIEKIREPQASEGGRPRRANLNKEAPYDSDPPLMQNANQENIKSLEEKLVKDWKRLVGGYFRRFRPPYFSMFSDYKDQADESDALKSSDQSKNEGVAIEEVLSYSFLKADYDFVSAQAAKQEETKDSVRAERPLNEDDILGRPGLHAVHIGGPKMFKGGSTCSTVLVSTPTPMPFWHPATTSSLIVAHVGDTRILVCSTATGQAIPLTTNHHPSSPVESNRLRRYATSFVTDSFGEERISGLANTRAFGDINSKRLGVSAEPEIKRVDLGAAEYSFMVLMSDGISGTLGDQEVVDIAKEAKTPDQAARDIVNFATEVSVDGDNATCMVVRLGGWERRQEGGFGSLGTKESREFKRQDAADPRNRRR